MLGRLELRHNNRRYFIFPCSEIFLSIGLNIEKQMFVVYGLIITGYTKQSYSNQNNIVLWVRMNKNIQQIFLLMVPTGKHLSSSDSIIMVFCTGHVRNIAGFSQTFNRQNKIVRK